MLFPTVITRVSGCLVSEIWPADRYQILALGLTMGKERVKSRIVNFSRSDHPFLVLKIFTTTLRNIIGV